MEPRLSVITLGVTDFDRSLAFYRDGLRWPVRVREDIAFFTLGGIVLALYPKEKLAGMRQSTRRGAVLPASRLPKLQRGERGRRGVEDGRKNRRAHRQESAEGFLGRLQRILRRADGYLWEVVHNPFWKLDERGNVVL